MKDSRLRFAARTPFTLALQGRVDAYFDDKGHARTGGGRMMAKSAILFAWLILSYAGLLALGNSWLALLGFAVSAGFAAAGIGMAVMHDGGHRAYSSRPGINRLSASVLDLLGGSSYIWRVKHGTIHHTYPNVEGVDDDLDAGAFARLSPSQPHRGFHRFQHLYIWPLYGLLTAKWFFYEDFANLAAGTIGGQRLQRPRGAEMVLFVFGKLFHATWALIIPFVLLGWAKGLLFYLVYSLVHGVILSVVFQLAHCVEEAAFIDPNLDAPDRDFFTHQLATTVDFGRSNKLLSWYVGGLNFQAVHHLFPRISHIHYPALARLVEQTAREYGVGYSSNASFMSALGSHYRWLRHMGRTPSPVPA